MEHRYWQVTCLVLYWTNICLVDFSILGVSGVLIHVYSTFNRNSCYQTVYGLIYEPRHDKTNKMSVRPAKTQISLSIRPVWSAFSLCVQWVAKDQRFFMRITKTLIRLAGCPGWPESSLGAQSLCWFVHVAAHIVPGVCVPFPFEPSHEIMALFVLRKLILQTRMRSHPVGLEVWFLVGPFVYFHTSCMRKRRLLRDCADAQARLRLRWSPMW